MSKKKRSRPSGRAGAASGETDSTPSLPPCPDCGAPVRRTSTGAAEVDHALTCPVRVGRLRAHEDDKAWFRDHPGALYRDRKLTQGEADHVRSMAPGCRAGDDLRVGDLGNGRYLMVLPRVRAVGIMVPAGDLR